MKEYALEKELINLSFWESLSLSEKESVQGAASVRRFEKGSLFGGECGCLGLIRILRGSIRVYMISEEGREITLFSLKKGSDCVLSASCVIRQITFETQMVAESDCDVLVIDTGCFGRLVESNIYVRCFMYELMAERFSSVMWTMQTILFCRFDRRLASFLVKEYERNNSSEIYMTHEQIAVQVNSAREVVARMLKRFSNDGLVEVRRGVVRIKNIEGLRRIR